MLDKKLHCENLYKEFLTVKKETDILVQDYIKNGVFSHEIKAEDLIKKEELRQQILDCRDCLVLTPEEWLDIENN